VCKNKQGISKHQNICLKSEKGESFLKNDWYTKDLKVVDFTDKILPASQPLTDFDALNKVCNIFSNIAVPTNDTSPMQQSQPQHQPLVNSSNQPDLAEIEISPANAQVDKEFRGLAQTYFFQKVDEIYNEIVDFRRNLFNVPSWNTGKEFIKELTYWIKQFNANSALNSVALKTYMILPTLILQKPSAKSKARDHTRAIERRMELWKKGEIESLLTEIRFIQKKFRSSTKPRDSEEVSKVFAKLVFQGKLTAAVKFLYK
jgi:hypothetical protein